MPDERDSAIQALLGRPGIPMPQLDYSRGDILLQPEPNPMLNTFGVPQVYNPAYRGSVPPPIAYPISPYTDPTLYGGNYGSGTWGSAGRNPIQEEGPNPSPSWSFSSPPINEGAVRPQRPKFGVPQDELIPTGQPRTGEMLRQISDQQHDPQLQQDTGFQPDFLSRLWHGLSAPSANQQAVGLMAQVSQTESPRSYDWYLNNPPPQGTPVPDHLEYVRRMQEAFDRETHGKFGSPLEQREHYRQHPEKIPQQVPVPRPGTVPITPGTLSPDANPKVRRMRDYRWGSTYETG